MFPKTTFKIVNFLTLSMLLSTANAVLPAVATDNTAMDNSVAVPLIPQMVPNINTSRPVTAIMPTGTAPNLPLQNASQNQLQTKITASLVASNPQGGEVLAPITPTTPLPKGTLIEYHGYILNQSPERVKTLKTTFNIPNGTELQSVTSVNPQPAYGSNDGQQFNYMPIRTNLNGVLQEVPTSYYKAIQWDIAGLGLNEVAEVKYRVVVK